MLDVSAKVRSPKVEVSSCARFACRDHVTTSNESCGADMSHVIHMVVTCAQSEGTNPGSLTHGFGGVARNIVGKPT